MFRQVYESRGKRSNLESEIVFRRIMQREDVDRTETSFCGNIRLTQKQFEDSMKHADEVAKKLLYF